MASQSVPTDSGAATAVIAHNFAKGLQNLAGTIADMNGSIALLIEEVHKFEHVDDHVQGRWVIQIEPLAWICGQCGVDLASSRIDETTAWANFTDTIWAIGPK
jgi:hypothetical protein